MRGCMDDVEVDVFFFEFHQFIAMCKATAHGLLNDASIERMIFNRVYFSLCISFVRSRSPWKCTCRWCTLINRHVGFSNMYAQRHLVTLESTGAIFAVIRVDLITDCFMFIINMSKAFGSHKNDKIFMLKLVMNTVQTTCVQQIRPKMAATSSIIYHMYCQHGLCLGQCRMHASCKRADNTRNQR